MSRLNDKAEEILKGSGITIKVNPKTKAVWYSDFNFASINGETEYAEADNKLIAMILLEYLWGLTDGSLESEKFFQDYLDWHESPITPQVLEYFKRKGVK